eukprot:gene3606-3653_t
MTKNAMALILLVACIVLLIFRPLILHPANVPDAVLHSTLLLDLVPFAAMGLTIWRMTEPRDSDPSGIRRAKLTVSMALLPVIFVLFIGPGLYESWRDYQDFAQIRRDGAPAMARVVKIYEVGCGKKGCRVDVRYQFAVPGPAGATRLVTGYDTPGKCANGAFTASRQSGMLPVVYSRSDPAVSRVDTCGFRRKLGSDTSFVRDHAPGTGLFASIFAAFFVILFRARRRLGSRLLNA